MASSKKELSSIELLPKELLIEILFYFSPQFLSNNIARVSQQFNVLFASSLLWEKKYYHHFPLRIKQPKTEELYSYKNFKAINECKDSPLSKTARRIFANAKDGDFRELGTYKLSLISITTSFKELNANCIPRGGAHNLLIKDKNGDYQLWVNELSTYGFSKIDINVKIPSHWIGRLEVNVYPGDEIFNAFKIKLNAIRYKRVMMHEMQELSNWARNARHQTLMDFCYDLVISEYPYNTYIMQGLTKLHWAVYFDQSNEIIQSLSNEINRVDFENKSPLFLAAEIGNLNAVKQLITIQDIDVNLPSCRPLRAMNSHQDKEYKLTPLHAAAKGGHVKIVEALLADTRVDLNIKTEYKNTAFYLAVMNKHPEVVRLFLADTRCDLQIEENNPLFIAAQQGNLETVRLLIHDGRIFINQRLANGATPLFIAAQLGHKEIVELLLQCPLIDINLPLKSTAELLVTFAHKNNVQEAMQAFLQRNQIKSDSVLITPRHIATIMGHEPIVALFDTHQKKSIAAQITLGFLSNDRRKIQPSRADKTDTNTPNYF